MVSPGGMLKGQVADVKRGASCRAAAGTMDKPARKAACSNVARDFLKWFLKNMAGAQQMNRGAYESKKCLAGGTHSVVPLNHFTDFQALFFAPQRSPTKFPVDHPSITA